FLSLLWRYFLVSGIGSGEVVFRLRALATVRAKPSSAIMLGLLARGLMTVFSRTVAMPVMPGIE
ncbi:hypothetical protein, partial [Pseudomonas viridiflava]|uniref:hypothetical protein n=1 Tax=Pseudomonas viridiflava TaxID=33069 RepID=UPI001E41CD50